MQTECYCLAVHKNTRKRTLEHARVERWNNSECDRPSLNPLIFRKFFFPLVNIVLAVTIETGFFSTLAFYSIVLTLGGAVVYGTQAIPSDLSHHCDSGQSLPGTDES